MIKRTHTIDPSSRLRTAAQPNPAWVTPSATRNYVNQDPLLDWLQLHGKAHGFVPDDEREGYAPRTDFLQMLFKKGNEFEAVVVAHLAKTHSITKIAERPYQASERSALLRTFETMCEGAPIIHQGVLWNPENQTYGIPDLLVRSDVLHALFPDDFSAAEASHFAPSLTGARWHYRVVDIKLTTLGLVRGGHAGSDHRAYMAQVWLYNAALAWMQGYLPSASYLLGPGWSASGDQRGTSALERLARVDQAHVLHGGLPLEALVRDACAWLRRVRTEGAGWKVLPTPSVEELRPNLRQDRDQPWHAAKREIANESSMHASGKRSCASFKRRVSRR